MQNLGAFFAEYRKKPGFAGLRCSLRSLHSALLRSATKSLQSLAHEPRAASLRGSPWLRAPVEFNLRGGWIRGSPWQSDTNNTLNVSRAGLGAFNPLRTNRKAPSGLSFAERVLVCRPPLN